MDELSDCKHNLCITDNKKIFIMIGAECCSCVMVSFVTALITMDLYFQLIV